MSITGSLTQISPYLLEQVKEAPSILDVFWSVLPVDDEEPKIDNLHGLSSDRFALLHEILPSPEQAVGQWTLQDLARIESWKAEHPENYELLKADVYRIVTEGKTTPTLDLFQDWHLISYIFSNDTSMDILPFLTDGVGENSRVNAILCGQAIDEFTRYLAAEEVQEVTEALSMIADNTIQQRIEQGSRSCLELYSYWIEEGHEGLLEFCNDVKEFYKDALNQKNAMLIKIV